MSTHNPGRFPVVPDEQIPGEVTQSVRFVARVILGFSVICVLFVLAVRHLAPDQAPGFAAVAEVALPDGSRGVVLAVTTGTKHELEVNDRTTWIDWLSRRPARQVLRVPAATPSLTVWVTRMDRREDRGQPWFDLRHARLEVGGEELLARHGTLFIRNYGMTSYALHASSPPFNVLSLPAVPRIGSSELWAFQFQQPPAGSGDMQFSVLGDATGHMVLPGLPATLPVLSRTSAPLPRPVLATWRLPEPSGLPLIPGTTPSPLPAVATSGPWTLRLNALRHSGSNTVPGVDPLVQHRFDYDVTLSDTSGDLPCQIVSYGPVVDAAGNSFPMGYRYPAPLRFGPHQLHITTIVPWSAAEEATSKATSPPLEIPARLATSPRTERVGLAGGRVQIQLSVTGGGGLVTHTNPFGSLVLSPNWTGDVNGRKFNISRRTAGTAGGSGRARSVSELSVDTPGFHLFYNIAGLAMDERLRVAAVRDDQGRSVPFEELQIDQGRCLVTDPAADAKAIVIDWAIDKLATFQFTISPPVVPVAVP
jgi:hypothetical protein